MLFNEFEEEEEYAADSGPEYYAGFMLVPVSDEKHVSEVILSFLAFTNEPTVGSSPEKHVSRQEYVEDYSTSTADVIFANDFHVLVQFGPFIDGYYSIMMKAHRSNFNGFPDRYPPTTIEGFLARMTCFVQTWVHVCASLQTEFAFYRIGSGHTTEKWLKEFILPDLNPVDPASLLLPISWDYWLTYLGPGLVPYIPSKDLQRLNDIKITTLPSGALVLRNRLSPLLLADESLYDAFFEQEIDLSHRASE
jgi:hypothetical protein